MSRPRRFRDDLDLVRLVDRMLAPELRTGSGDELWKLRLTVSAMVASLCLIPLGIVMNGLRGNLLSAWANFAAMVGFAVVLAYVRRHGTSALVGHAIGLCASTSALVHVIAGGDIHGPAMLGQVAVPVAMFFLVGARAGWVWCGVGVLAYAVAAGRSMAPADLEKASVLALVAVGLTSIVHAFDALHRIALTELDQARREAQASAEARSQFLANTSHEIRTPLNGVLGMLGIVLDSRLDPDQRSQLETAHASGMALLDLLNDILDFSKAHARQLGLEAAPFDLRALVEDVLDQVAVPAAKKDVELIARYVPGTPTHVVGDHGRIRQVLLNVVSNAVKFTERGHVLVTLESTPKAGASRTYRCTVEDTGIGIPLEKQELVFEAFRQVDGSTTRKHAGTGLGLAIVRELVQLMQGRLGLESELGKGSTLWFELDLPLSPESLPEPEMTAGPSGLRVLVVDDYWVNRSVLEELLVHWGFRVEECGSAERALELLREAVARGEPFDLALLDHQLPRLDVMALARAIKADERIRGISWVMLSSITHRPSNQELQAAGCAAYLVKPVHQSDLENVLAAVWARRGIEGALPITRPQRAVEKAEILPVAQGLRVLVVEDNVVNQKVAQRILLDLGCRVDVAADGVEAVALTTEVPYDLVFMDVQMPRMDGLEATRELRRREAVTGGRLRVVAMTAHAMPEDRERCLAAGMDGYLTKPIKRRDLIRELSKQGSARAGAPAGESPPDEEPAPGRTPTWDLEWLRSNYAPDDITLRSLVELFVESAEQPMRELAAALRDGNVSAQRSARHALLGICGAIGATRMHQILSASPQVDASALEELQREYVALRACFEETLGELPVAGTKPS